MCGARFNRAMNERAVLHALIAATPNRSDYGDRCLAPGSLKPGSPSRARRAVVRAPRDVTLVNESSFAD